MRVDFLLHSKDQAQAYGLRALVFGTHATLDDHVQRAGLYAKQLGSMGLPCQV